MEAIITKYVGPTSTKGSRIKATCDAGSTHVTWDHGLSVEKNHEAAARALIQQIDWTQAAGYQGEWVGGHLPNGDYVFCLTRASQQFTV